MTLVERADALTPELRDELLRAAYEQADRLRLLLEQLFDLSQLDARALKVNPQHVSLPELLQKIAADAVPGAPVELDVDEDLAVVADPFVLDRVVSNVLTNAVRHGSPPIVLAAEARGRHLHIAVDDHGGGVPEELEPRLFDRFVREEGVPGSGLGLSIARAYARAHGGDLVYRRREVGSRFELIVPNR